ncbi:MAG TPA: chloramphenicol acetyltransferase [Ruminococcus sp.]|nr:chloramphenicol acetyltransferase [Ruminococcus sp.]
MQFRKVDMETYYRRGVFRHFSEDCKCSVSITNRIDVTELRAFSKRTGTRFYINFLYCLSHALNAREDYRLAWDWQTETLLCWDRIHPTQYIFHEDTETFTVAYTEYDPDYRVFYARAEADCEAARQTRDYGLDSAAHPNWFDASCVPWLSYDALHVELPDGYLYFSPIVNWGAYREENGRFRMPVTVRLNHAAADGYQIARVFQLLEQAICELTESVC